MEKLLKPSEVADLLNVGINKIYDMSKRNQLPVIKIGSSLRFKEAEIERWISEHTNK